MFENAKREYEKLTVAKDEYNRLDVQRRNLKIEYKEQGKGWNEYLKQNDLLCEEMRIKEKAIKIMENNYLYVLKQEAIPVLQKVFDKYIGKRIGEKTKDKIRGEFKELGLYVGWYCEYSSTFKFEVCLSEHNYSSFKLYLYDGIYDENGKLKQLNFNDMICYEVSKYIENAEERIAEMERLEKEISEKTEKLNKIIETHYNLCVSGMEIYDTVYIKKNRR